MEYSIAIRTIQVVKVNADNEDAAIQAVKASIHPSMAATASFQIVQDTVYDEETQSYKTI